LDQADEFREQTGAAWALITDGAGILHAWTYERYVFDDDLSESSLVGLALQGDSTQGVWIEPTDEGDVIFQAVGVPVFDPSRTSIYAVLVTALVVDSTFAADLQRHTASDVVFFGVDTLGVPQVAVSTLRRGPIDSAVASLDPDSALADPTQHTRIRMPVAGETLVGVAGGLYTASGFAVGGYVGFRSREVELAAFTELRRTMWYVFGGEVTSGDEIGELAAAFEHMVRELKAKDELVEYLSGGSEVTIPLPRAAASSRTEPVERRAPTIPSRFVAQQLEIGSLLAKRYEIRDILGTGGMGVVYRAHDRELDETVAIKTLRPDVGLGDTSMLDRFKQEIRLARRITHRNVVRTHDLGEVDGMYFITMEYVDGTTLKELIRKRGRLPPAVTVTIGKQLCRALAVAHEQGVIHRDIKPQNMVVDPSGFLKVMDFGIARLEKRSKEGLTSTGAAVGTADYIPPEQLMGENLDGRADLYSAGVVLFECVTGRPVFSAPTLMALMAKHLEDQPEDPRTLNADVPEALSRVILKALEKKPSHRFASAMAMYEALDAIRIKARAA
jgi:HAMP domain-containing protein